MELFHGGAPTGLRLRFGGFLLATRTDLGDGRFVFGRNGEPGKRKGVEMPEQGLGALAFPIAGQFLQEVEVFRLFLFLPGFVLLASERQRFPQEVFFRRRAPLRVEKGFGGLRHSGVVARRLGFAERFEDPALGRALRLTEFLGPVGGLVGRGEASQTFERQRFVVRPHRTAVHLERRFDHRRASRDFQDAFEERLIHALRNGPAGTGAEVLPFGELEEIECSGLVEKTRFVLEQADGIAALLGVEGGLDAFQPTVDGAHRFRVGVGKRSTVTDAAVSSEEGSSLPVITFPFSSSSPSE